jgi:2-C-methyl-D-erythritol 2,4-cyclodiphosphate synthase
MTRRRTPARRRPRASASAGSPPATKGPVPRIGLGIDRHPFQPGRRLVLGGLVIDGCDGLRGHSDADVLTHAVCDAILGALGLPDLGTRFPAAEETHRDRKSILFLRDIAGEMRTRHYGVGNLDAVILAEKPALASHLPAMRTILARALGCDPDRVSIKPKRGEGLGFVGRGEGIEAHATVLLVEGVPRDLGRRTGSR